MKSDFHLIVCGFPGESIELRQICDFFKHLSVIKDSNFLEIFWTGSNPLILPKPYLSKDIH